jgi:hypothetical protein
VTNFSHVLLSLQARVYLTWPGFEQGDSPLSSDLVGSDVMEKSSNIPHLPDQFQQHVPFLSAVFASVSVAFNYRDFSFAGSTDELWF